VDVRFPKSSVTSTLPDNYTDTKKHLKEMKWKRETMLEDIKREQALLDTARQSFERKKEEFVKFLAQSSAYATRVRLEHTLLFMIDSLNFQSFVCSCFDFVCACVCAEATWLAKL